MKLSDAWNNYYAYTGKASEITRSLALASLALVWIFKDTNGQLPKILFLPSTLAILALACDLAQYVAGSIAWGGFARSKDAAAKTLEEEIGTAPGGINRVATGFYVGKLILVAGACAVLLCYAAGRFFES